MSLAFLADWTTRALLDPPCKRLVGESDIVEAKW
jgi:hypothetical protein